MPPQPFGTERVAAHDIVTPRTACNASLSLIDPSCQQNLVIIEIGNFFKFPAPFRCFGQL